MNGVPVNRAVVFFVVAAIVNTIDRILLPTALV